MEQNLRRCLQIGDFILKKNVELIYENRDLTMMADEAKAAATNAANATSDKLQEKEWLIQELQGQKVDLTTRVEELETELQDLAGEYDAMRDNFAAQIDIKPQPSDSVDWSQQRPREPTHYGSGSHRVSRQVLIQEHESKVLELENLVAQQTSKLEDAKGASSKLLAEVQLQDEKILLLSGKCKRGEEKIRAQAALITELEDVINDLTEQITRDKLEEQKRQQRLQSSNVMDQMLREQDIKT